jgi:UDP-N-acetylmuramoyl-tripeptide--D-alanyl-D-alanine ligase
VNHEDFYKTYLQYPQICTDSRNAKPGCLYFSLKGDHFDGNSFAADALKKGCALAVVDDPAVAVGEKYILVRDALLFLQNLALYHRKQLNIPVIGLTGTNGKTTTKELLYSVLKQKFSVVATSGNLNNHIGVPLTILAANKDTEILIVEMGANHPGEIAFLCNIAIPTCGLITNIGKAHLEGFGSIESVICTKNELYESIKSRGGRLFVNTDDELLIGLIGDYTSISTYGGSDKAWIRGSASRSERDLSVTWSDGGNPPDNHVISHLAGSYNLYNVLAAIAIGSWFGLINDQINKGIHAYQPQNMRSQWIESQNNSILLDAYNANPSSMELAIEYFAELSLPNTVVILGDMFELGKSSSAEHLKILELVEKLKFDRVLFVGNQFFQYSGNINHEFFESLNSVKEFLIRSQIKGCNVLIKGSRGMKLEQLIDHL